MNSTEHKIFKKNKTLFVEPTEYGHVLLHLASFFNSEVWESQHYNILTPACVKERLISEEIINKKKADSLFIPLLSNSTRLVKYLQLLQICRLIKKNKYTNVCFKYLDYHLFLTPFIKILYPRIMITGIFFRPIMHYRKQKYPYDSIPKMYWLLMLLKNWFLVFFLKNGTLNSCFFQDEGAVIYLKRKSISAFWLPTPIDSNFSILQTKKQNSNIRFLFFGQIARRKGIYRVLETWKYLSPEYQSKIELNIIGRTAPDEYALIKYRIDELIKMGWEINYVNRFVANSEIPNIYSYADIVLSPHDLQFGTSGVTIQAVVWRKPIIVHNLGWVGKFVNSNKIGLAINSNDVRQFSEAITNIIDKKIKISIEEDFASRLSKIHSGKRWPLQLYKGIFIER